MVRLGNGAMCLKPPIFVAIYPVYHLRPSIVHIPCEGLPKETMHQTWFAIEQLVRSFQDGTLPRDRWTHPAHLTIAGWYLLNHCLEDATTQIRNEIQRYNAALGIRITKDSGYHETLTLFWIYTVHQFLMKQNQRKPPLQTINELIQVCNDPHLPLRHYSHDRLFSWEARISWLEPDLMPLEDNQLSERL